MKTIEFLTLLADNPAKELLFEYQGGKLVPKAYHITEVKNTHVDSVDCGGNEHSYDETVVQLWISGNEQKDQYMLAEKAKEIFDIVHKKRPLKEETPIFFEYGDQDTPTSVYTVDTIEENEGFIKVKMSVPPTACKPRLSLNVVAVGGNACGANGFQSSSSDSGDGCRRLAGSLSNL